MKERKITFLTFSIEDFSLVSWLRYFSDFLILTKPGIILLVGVTTLSGSILASPYPLFPSVLIPTLVTLLAAAGSAIWNHVLDRDLDSLMERTRVRPLPSGRFPVLWAKLLGGIFVLLSLVIALKTGGVLPAFLVFLAVLSYALLYTAVLKRRTPYCTELGGISGSLPPLIGWVYFHDHLTPMAFFLPLLLFFWQPPHFWILGILASKEYQKAKIPIFPVTHGLPFTKLRTLGYTLLFLWISILPLIWGKAGRIYGFFAVILGVIHLLLVLRFTFESIEPRRTLRFFFFSLFHLFFLCAVISAEKSLGASA
jgi:protoheme IX farnesyltransferase